MKEKIITVTQFRKELLTIAKRVKNGVSFLVMKHQEILFRIQPVMNQTLQKKKEKDNFKTIGKRLLEDFKDVQFKDVQFSDPTGDKN